MAFLLVVDRLCSGRAVKSPMRNSHIGDAQSGSRVYSRNQSVNLPRRSRAPALIGHVRKWPEQISTLHSLLWERDRICVDEPSPRRGGRAEQESELGAIRTARPR